MITFHSQVLFPISKMYSTIDLYFWKDTCVADGRVALAYFAFAGKAIRGRAVHIGEDRPSIEFV